MKNSFVPRAAARLACWLLAFSATTVLAQDLAVTSNHAGSFTAGQTGIYGLVVQNPSPTPSSGLVTAVNSLPAGLTPTAATGVGWTCSIAQPTVTCTRSDSLAPLATFPAIQVTVDVAPNAPASVTNTVLVTGGGDTDLSNNISSDPTTIIAVPDLVIAKQHSGSFLPGQVGATYTLTVRNIGSAPTAGPVTVSDVVPTGLTFTIASGTGWTCTVAVDLICTRADALPAGASYPPITLTLNVAPAPPAVIPNTADVSGGSEVNTANNSATDSTTVGPGPDVVIAKSHSGSFVAGQSGAVYTMTVTNRGNAPTLGPITVSDTLPTGLTPTAGAGSGWLCTVVAPTVTCTRSDSLAPGGSYPSLAITSTVAANAPPAVTNTVTVSGGGDANAANNSASDPTTIVPGADLTITKSHVGNFTRGQVGAQYTLTVTNPGAGPSVGTVTVSDVLPSGLTPTAAAGTGWTCNVGGAGVLCTRGDTLAAGANFPPITILVDVSNIAPALVTNTAQVLGDVAVGNNTASDPTTILAGPDVALVKSHVGNFTQGQVGAAYTINISNVGGSPTSGLVTVDDFVPAGLTPASASGIGWTCGIAGSTVTCTRSDPLAAGASYPPITLTVNVALGAPASVINVANVAAVGDTDVSNNAFSDPTVINGIADLAITKSHVGNFTQGQVGATYTISVVNTGGAPSAGTVTVTDTLPAGLTPTAATGTGWTCGIAGATVTCTRSDALPGGASYPAITLTVNVANNAAASLTNTAVVSGGADANPANNSSSDPTTVSSGPDLAIAKSHAGSFTQGQVGALYTITASNAGLSATTGTTTVTDTVPTGLTPTGAAGTGWTCGIAGAIVTCTRADALAAGASYPPITLTVNVAGAAPASVTNTAVVSGGGDVNAANNTANDITAIVGGPVLDVTVTPSGTFTQGLAASYAIVVRNAGASPTTAPVTVTDVLPTGVVPTGATGTGWSCTVVAQTVTCTRADALAAGASYPTLTVPVNVTAAAGTTITNTVTASGGGAGVVGSASVASLIAAPGTPQAVPTLQEWALLALLLLLGSTGVVTLGRQRR